MIQKSIATKQSTDATGTSVPSEASAARQYLTDVMTWMREPDWTEEASIEWLMDWINRRPIAALGMIAMLMPNEDRT